MKRILTVLAGLGAAVIVGQLVAWLPDHFARTDTANLDFTVYYRAAIRFALRQPVYTDGFMYPPPFVALISPAALLSPHAFQGVWYTLMVAAFWAYAWGLARIAFRQPTWQHVLATGFVLLATPGMRTVMSFGNADVIVWALVAWGIAEESLFLLLVATSLKVYPAAAVFMLAIRGRGLGDLVLGVSVIVLFAVLLAGNSVIAEWWHAGAMPLDLTFLFLPGNVSLSTGALRLFGMHSLTVPAKMVLHGVSGLVVAATGWWTWRWSPRAQAAALVLAMTWVAPFCWSFRFPLVLVAVAVWWREHGEAVAERIQAYQAARRAGL